MALLDIFKKFKKGLRKEKKEERKTEKKKIKKEKKLGRAPTVKEEIKKEPPKPKKRTSETAYRVLSSPNITEKATFLTKENKYVFKVRPRTNKTEIKKIIEDMYGVNVIDVNIINIPAKKRTVRKRIGWKKGYKKAVIKIREGQKIEVLPR